MKKTIIISLAFLLITGCEKTTVTSRAANSSSIERTIQRAKEGVISANDSISILLGLSLTENNNYNKLKIDSLVLPSGKYFTILLEYPNPVNNKLGIYNDSLKTLLLDKSLYGELSENIVTINGNKYIKLNEGFSVKDVFELSRLSLYEIENGKANLIFRTFTRLKEPEAEYTQVINEFSNEQIITKININKKDFTADADIFKRDSTSNSYISKQNFFTDFVKHEIRNLPQI